MTYQFADPCAVQRAFNEGCDARLAGWPMSYCPYLPTEISLYESWRRGWLDVQHSWGKESPWPVRPLPPVKEATRA